MNLELVTTKDLIEEITKRFDDSIFYGRKITPEDDPNIATHNWKGDPFICQGMAMRIMHLCATYQDRETTELGDEDA